MYLQPRYIHGITVSMAPLNTSEPACSATLSGVMRQAPANSAQYIARM